MPVRILTLAAAVVLLAAAAGCGPGKLNETRSFKLTHGDINAVTMPVQSKPQKITVDVDSDNAVDVFLADTAKVKTDDVSLQAFVKLGPQQQAAKSLGSKTGIKKDSLVVDVPPNTEYSVLVTNAVKTADVKIAVTNQK